MFSPGYQSSVPAHTDELRKPAPRFAPKVIAQLLGKPLADYTRDRVFNDGPQLTAKPKTAKKKKPMQEKTAVPISVAGKAPEGIQSTKHYDKFRFLPTNRSVDQRHVNKLVAAIRAKNLLNLNPIVVNGRFEVIDGQHRLEAAKKLGIAIFYAQDEAVSQDDIAGMNSNKKNWAMMDYIHFYAAQDKPEYVQFTAFCAEHPAISPTTLIAICTKDGNVKRTYKDGVLDISNIERAKETLRCVADYEGHTQYANSSKFVEALAFIIRTGLYSHEQMMGKLETNPGILQPSPTTRGYIESLERIYNRKMREENIVIFLKRR